VLHSAYTVSCFFRLLSADHGADVNKYIYLLSNCYSILFTNSTRCTESNESRAKVLIHIICIYIAFFIAA